MDDTTYRDDALETIADMPSAGMRPFISQEDAISRLINIPAVNEPASFLQEEKILRYTKMTSADGDHLEAKAAGKLVRCKDCEYRQIAVVGNRILEDRCKNWEKRIMLDDFCSYGKYTDKWRRLESRLGKVAEKKLPERLIDKWEAMSEMMECQHTWNDGRVWIPRDEAIKRLDKLTYVKKLPENPQPTVAKDTNEC